MAASPGLRRLHRRPFFRWVPQARVEMREPTATPALVLKKAQKAPTWTGGVAPGSGATTATKAAVASSVRTGEMARPAAKGQRRGLPPAGLEELASLGAVGGQGLGAGGRVGAGGG